MARNPLHEVGTICRDTLHRLRRDTRGDTSVISLILILALICLGAIIGLATIRDQVVQQLGDIAVALDSLDQSFSYTITINHPNPTPPTVLTCQYADPSPTLTDPANAAPACLVIDSATVLPEGTPFPPGTPAGTIP